MPLTGKAASGDEYQAAQRGNNICGQARVEEEDWQRRLPTYLIPPPRLGGLTWGFSN